MTDIKTRSCSGVHLIGELPVRLWGLALDDWQRRFWKKIGGDQAPAGAAMLAGIDWVLSPALAKSLLDKPGAALIVRDQAQGQERIAVLHLPEGSAPDAFSAQINAIDPDWDQLRKAGFTPGYMDDFVGQYDEALRKREAPYALSLLTTTPAAVEQRLFRGSYKGVTDLVTKYVWPVPALHATRFCANLGISPNAVTTASLVLVCLAFWLFWIGAWIPGLLAGWGMTFLDTVDGKLARTTMTYSKWGNVYDHGIDLIHPPFWYGAIYIGLTASGASHAWLLPSLIVIIGGYAVGRVIEGIFLRAFGFHIHVWERVDAVMREITARRNPNLLIFTLAVLGGAPAFGFIAVAAWTLICTPFHIVRLLMAYASKTPVGSYLST